MHIENTYKVIECLAQRIREEFDKGIDNIDTEEMEKAICMLEKSGDALYKFYVIKAMENPITAEIGYDWNDDPARLTMDILGSKKLKQPEWSNYNRYGRRNYTNYAHYYEPDYDWDYDMGQYGVKHRMGNVNYASHNDHMMDDRMNYRNYDNSTSNRSYSDGYQAGMRDSQPDYREGRSGNKRMTYMVSKQIHDSNTPDDIAKNNKLLDEYLDTVEDDMKELTQMMTPNEKAMLKSKMNTMLTKIV